MGPVFLNIEFIQAGQGLKLLSMRSKSNESYWQILYGTFDNNDTVIYSNEYINENDPGISNRPLVFNNSINTILPDYYEVVTYDDSTTGFFDMDKSISVLELKEDLDTDLFITLPNLDFMGIEKLIVMGESVSKYINNYTIIINTILMDLNGNGPHTMNIEFHSTGQNIKLISFVNKRNNSYGYKNKYWQVIHGSYELYSFNDLITEDIIIYTESININLNVIGFINLQKDLSLLELNTSIQSDIYILLPFVNLHGYIKTIVFGESINTYINNKNIIIYGKFYDNITNTIKCLSLKFNKSGQSLRIISVNNADTNNKYWTILSGDYVLDNTNVDSLYNNYLNTINLNISTTYQELTIDDSFNMNKNLYFINLDSQLSEDYIFTLDNLNKTGIKKLFVLSDSALDNLNNHNIIIKSNFYEVNQSDSMMLKIKLNSQNNYLELLSIDNLSNKYYQILNNIDSSFIEFDNSQQTFALVPQPVINYEIITYDNLKNNILSTSLEYSILELNENLNENIYIYLPISLITNVKKTLILGKSIDTYINNKTIILLTILIDDSHSAISYYTINFTSSGQYINLISITNSINNYYQIINSVNSNLNTTNPNDILISIINPSSNTVDSSNLFYTENELNSIEIFTYKKNIYNIIDFTKKFTVLELTEYLTEDIHILIPNLKVNGVEKTIIMGQSVSHFSNNYKIILYSKYKDLEGRGPMFLNLKLFKTGQILKTLSFISTLSSGEFNKYNQILIGSFESSDEIIFNSLGNYVNVGNPNESYNLIIDDEISIPIENNENLYSDLDNVYMHSNINITQSLNLNNDLNIKNITFSQLNSLPTYNTNTMIYSSDNLYFNHNNKWVELINNDLKLLNTEQLIYNSNIINIVNNILIYQL